MRTICRPRPVLLAIAASLCMMWGGSARSSDSARVRTEFGYVCVDPLDVQAAVLEGTAVRASAKRVLLLPDVRFALVEDGPGKPRWGQVSRGYVTYPWHFPNGSRRFAARSATHVLRHEIGHDLLARHLIPKSHKNQYGTDAPDWLDEIAAIAFEGPEGQADQRRAARRYADKTGLLPLSRLMSMTHPEFRTMSPDEIRGTSIDEPTSDETIRFYATIQAFYDYLLARTGDEAIVARLAVAFVRGDDLTAWIVEKTRSGDSPRSLERLNADFDRWFKGDPRYSGPGIGR